MKRVEEAIGERWILLGIDEYEYMGERLTDGLVDERLFQTLRMIIQNHLHTTVLLSGAHTLEDLPPVWSNYFINTRVIKIGPLSGREARLLITQPVPMVVVARGTVEVAGVAGAPAPGTSARCHRSTWLAARTDDHDGNHHPLGFVAVRATIWGPMGLPFERTRRTKPSTATRSLPKLATVSRSDRPRACECGGSIRERVVHIHHCLSQS
jgi:hypothetical protein